jgi:hypothetical protein
MYDLHNVGWNSFQQLCLTITGEILRQTVESFLDSGDGGRDGAFTGVTGRANSRTDGGGTVALVASRRCALPSVSRGAGR